MQISKKDTLEFVEESLKACRVMLIEAPFMKKEVVERMNSLYKLKESVT